MKRTIQIICIILLFSACNKNKTPDYVIPKEDMVNILIDMHMVDGIFSVSELRRELAAKDSLNLYDALLNNYNYTRSDFDTSLFYYGMHINEYDVIYEEILNKLSKMETKLKEVELNKDVQDSINF